MKTKEIKINCPEEVWKDIPGYETLYKISNLGRVKSLDRMIRSGIKYNKTVLRKGKILKQIPHHDGYLFVSLSKNNKSKTVAVHRLVANIFIENPENKPFIDHIDTNTGNNIVTNLRWVTASENVLNPITRERLRIANIGEKNPQYGKKVLKETIIKSKRVRKVSQFSKDGVFIKDFDFITEAAREVGVFAANIIYACKNFNRTSGGYKWKYKEMN